MNIHWLGVSLLTYPYLASQVVQDFFVPPSMAEFVKDWSTAMGDRQTFRSSPFRPGGAGCFRCPIPPG